MMLNESLKSSNPSSMPDGVAQVSMFEKSSFMRGKKQSISPFQDQPPKQQKT
jgi:hypothetical protein